MENESVFLTDLFDKLGQLEGSAYTDNPADSGGPTKWGITQTFLDSVLEKKGADFVSTKEVKNLTLEDRNILYLFLYNENPHLKEIIHPQLKGLFFVATVNMGPFRPTVLLQDACNEYRHLFASGDYPYLKLDGILGPKTIQNVNSSRGVLFSLFAERLKKKYTQLAMTWYKKEGDGWVPTGVISKGSLQKDRQFLKGWLKRVTLFEKEAVDKGKIACAPDSEQMRMET